MSGEPTHDAIRRERAEAKLPPTLVSTEVGFTGLPRRHQLSSPRGIYLLLGAPMAAGGFVSLLFRKLPLLNKHFRISRPAGRQ